MTIVIEVLDKGGDSGSVISKEGYVSWANSCVCGTSYDGSVPEFGQRVEFSNHRQASVRPEQP